LLADIPALKDILLYHVVEGRLFAADVLASENLETLQGKKAAVELKDEKPYVGGAQIVVTDILASNGVIHVIVTVILPPKDFVERAVADGRFTTLAAALIAADLIDTLKGEGPFTVFAPTDDAFAKLPAGTVEDLLKPENLETLRNILLYHVVPGKVLSGDVVTLTNATTVLGKDLVIKVENDKVFINNAQVIIVDVLASNGVIHVIDTVLIPE
jgi:transforming growth factor-beta-induced protein